MRNIISPTSARLEVQRPDAKCLALFRPALACFETLCPPDHTPFFPPCPFLAALAAFAGSTVQQMCRHSLVRPAGAGGGALVARVTSDTHSVLSVVCPAWRTWYTRAGFPVLQCYAFPLSDCPPSDAPKAFLISVLACRCVHPRSRRIHLFPPMIHFRSPSSPAPVRILQELHCTALVACSSMALGTHVGGRVRFGSIRT